MNIYHECISALITWVTRQTQRLLPTTAEPPLHPTSLQHIFTESQELKKGTKKKEDKKNVAN